MIWNFQRKNVPAFNLAILLLRMAIASAGIVTSASTKKIQSPFADCTPRFRATAGPCWRPVCSNRIRACWATWQEQSVLPSSTTIISSGAGSASSKLFRQLSNATPPLKTGTTIETLSPCKLSFVRGKIVIHPLCSTDYVLKAGESQYFFTVD